MTRDLILIGGVIFGLVVLNAPEMAQAQTPRTDTIRFMAATRGNDYDSDNLLEWCVSQKGWHIGWSDSAGNLGPRNSIDELAQWGPGRTNCSSDPARTGRTEPVDLWTYGFTSQASCTMSLPCISLHVNIVSTTTQIGQCKIIETHLIDYTSLDNTNLTGELKESSACFTPAALLLTTQQSPSLAMVGISVRNRSERL